MNDLKLALRQPLKNPGFTAVAVLTLATCLGANVVIFAVVDSVILRPLPFRESDRLVTTVNAYPKAGVPRAGSSLPNFYDRREAMMNLLKEEHARAAASKPAAAEDAHSLDRIR